VIVALAATAALVAGGLAPDAARGRDIYLRGDAGGGPPITASTDGWQSEVPASVLACASCHGKDGQGRPEGGVTPSVLTWDELTRPYRVVEGSGRTRPPYTESSLARAIVTGIDSGGNPLQPVMPRYRMTREQIRDLAAFLKRLGSEEEPGLQDQRLTVGMFVPRSGPQARIGEAMRGIVSALFARVNAAGGIYGRTLDLRVLRPEEGAGALRREPVFALVGGLGAGALDVAAVAEEQEVPLIAPVVTDPQLGTPPRRFGFYLFPGLPEQARALAAFAGQEIRPEKLRALIVHPASPRGTALADGIEAEGKQAGWAAAARIAYPEGHFDASAVAAAGQRATASAIFLLGGAEEAAALLGEAARRRFTPAVFLEGLQAGQSLLAASAAYDHAVYLAFPSLPLSGGSEVARDFQAVRGEAPQASLEAFQLWAYAGGRVLLEALRSAGRRLDREKLVAALEGLYDFDAGLPSAIRFGPGRRLGTSGATIVRLDPRAQELVVVRPWIAVEN
jgi:ABC-type branched-subunit amino acid transport system substrate-binding protein